ncbi:competence protein ComEA [Sporomusaceae bacterium BoRhaA]|uniref:helix-hairpin-helix domain-containing protein n=1 Tax=Pelorhabdus rhamnosifermentans TaxID=2772457 RepID=UPI001C063D5E|nr:ComEA family DNA-binding protein [Pelorhabdus rhamnosifermentans]MBU2701473.1 competence protein ComEA [Pelorhabdus rhamnosifermentans]
MGTYKKRLVIILVMAAMAVGVSFFIFSSKHSAVDAEFTNDDVVTEQKPSGKGKAKGDSVVYVTGAVNQPGLYTINDRLRVTELIALAGGTTFDADMSKVNMARVVKDGMHIHIPVVKEKKAAQTAGSVRQGHTWQGTATEAINVNTASVEELSTVKGISPQLAAQIVEYRIKKGAFASFEDLLHVPGFTPKRLNRVRDKLVI